METQELISALGYAESPNFLTVARFDEVPAHAHVFRRAARRCALQGVYLLRDESAANAVATPVLYLAEAEDQSRADSIHRQVWNQSVVPFLLVRTPRGVRLYSGFEYQRSVESEQPAAGVLESLVAFHEVSSRLAAFHAGQIDNGSLWRLWGEKVEPEKRVDNRLLGNLEAIGQELHQEGVPREVAHALIGKLVYLRYLRDRNILSDRRLQSWELGAEQVFGRRFEVKALQRLIEHLEDWLNGEIFPLSLAEGSGLSGEQVERTAAIFLGDDARADQLHLDFQAYDFSHIPIETLSSIYEQFLAIEGTSRESGAFYTPVPLVNFMVVEMEDHKPLVTGMRVLDPSCGSGAFLVQCYRHLIEKRMKELRRELRPTELRDLLVQQIFGVDRDEDACRVAQMSLVLTMLDYIDPPDLQSSPNFKLPKLHNRNIYQSDFFDDSSAWATGAGANRYDWIIGNPPWVVEPASDIETSLARWLAQNQATRPVNRRQAAEAFAWKVLDSTSREGVIGLLLPAMSLFKREPTSRLGFRRAFFRAVATLGVANFTNLRQVLFAGRACWPSAAVFYRAVPAQEPSDRILVYSPFVINQEANRPAGRSRRRAIWNLIPNSSEISFVDRLDLLTGASLPWKVAMWGTDRDRRLIEKTNRRFKAFGNWADELGLKVAEGPQLRVRRRARESLEPIDEVVGKRRLDSKRLRNLDGIHALMEAFTEEISAAEGFVRSGRKDVPLSICWPPHVVVSAARRYAFYTEEFLVIHPRQIGIAGSLKQSAQLKFLALYLSSDFVTYCEFFKSPQWGIRDGRSTLGTLRELPVPLENLEEEQLKEWSQLQGDLAEASRRHLASSLWTEASQPGELQALEDELNRKVEAVMGLSERERWLVRDLVDVRMSLTDGKLGEPAVRKPSRDDLVGYGEMLRDELDSFTEGLGHHVTIFSGRNQGFVSAEPMRGDHSPFPIDVRESDDPVAKEMDRLQRKHLHITRQWIYFDRNLFVYDSDRTLIFKPQQRIWWTRSQAMSDADEIIAAALVPEDSVA